MRNRDEKILEETYEKMSEGILDRIKAGGAQRQAVRDAGGGGIGGLVNKGKQGLIKKLGGNISSQDNQRNMQMGKAKADALAASYMAKIDELANEFWTSLEQTGVDSTMLTDPRAKEVFRALSGKDRSE